jgi:hypothetical protein
MSCLQGKHSVSELLSKQMGHSIGFSAVFVLRVAFALRVCFVIFLATVLVPVLICVPKIIASIVK